MKDIFEAHEERIRQLWYKKNTLTERMDTLRRASPLELSKPGKRFIKERSLSAAVHCTFPWLNLNFLAIRRRRILDLLYSRSRRHPYVYLPLDMQSIKQFKKTLPAHSYHPDFSMLFGPTESVYGTLVLSSEVGSDPYGMFDLNFEPHLGSMALSSQMNLWTFLVQVCKGLLAEDRRGDSRVSVFV